MDHGADNIELLKYKKSSDVMEEVQLNQNSIRSSVCSSLTHDPCCKSSLLNLHLRVAHAAYHLKSTVSRPLN